MPHFRLTASKSQRLTVAGFNYGTRTRAGSLNTPMFQAHRQLVFSSKGDSIAVANDYGVEIYDSRLLVHLANLPSGPERISSLRFSPDGSFVSGAGERGELVIWNVRSRKVKSRFETPYFGFQRFSPDGRTLVVWGQTLAGYFAIPNTTVQLWDVDSGKQLHIRPSQGESLSAVVASSNGRIVASGAASDPMLRHLGPWNWKNPA